MRNFFVLTIAITFSVLTTAVQCYGAEKQIIEFEHPSILRILKFKSPKIRTYSLGANQESLGNKNNFVAFIRAANACFEKNSVDQFVNTSKNCEVIRESTKNTELAILSGILNINVEEMVKLVDAGDAGVDAIISGLLKNGQTPQSVNRMLWWKLYSNFFKEEALKENDMSGVKGEIFPQVPDYNIYFYDISSK